MMKPTWSVMVMGARSTIFLSLRGGGPLPTTGICWVNTHRELPGKDSSLDLAFSNASSKSRLNTNPTRYWDSLDITNYFVFERKCNLCEIFPTLTQQLEIRYDLCSSAAVEARQLLSSPKCYHKY